MGKKKSSQKLAIAAASTGAAIGAAYLAVGNAIYDKALSKKSIVKQTSEKTDNYEGITKEGMDWYDSANPAKVRIVSPRGGYIHGEIVMAQEPTDVWVIVVHGYTGSPRRMGAFGKRFHEMGFNCLFPYLCGHGESESNYVSMGWDDRIDIKAWIDYIINEDHSAKIVLFGLSMGAATVMMATGELLPDNVVCAIEDCGFTSAWDEGKVKIKDLYGLPTFPFLTAARSATKLRAGYDIKKASCLEQVSHSTTPTLFIHGDKDDFVPFWMQERVYRAASCEKEKLIIPGATHAQASNTDPELYWTTVDKFIKKHI